MFKKQRLVKYSFRPKQILAMRNAFQKACEAPQVAGGAPDVTGCRAENSGTREGRRDEPRPSMHRRLTEIIALTLPGRPELLSPAIWADASRQAGRFRYARLAPD
jgi:hypothetical protein